MSVSTRASSKRKAPQQLPESQSATAGPSNSIGNATPSSPPPSRKRRKLQPVYDIEGDEADNEMPQALISPLKNPARRRKAQPRHVESPSAFEVKEEPPHSPSLVHVPIVKRKRSTPASDNIMGDAASRKRRRLGPTPKKDQAGRSAQNRQDPIQSSIITLETTTAEYIPLDFQSSLSELSSSPVPIPAPQEPPVEVETDGLVSDSGPTPSKEAPVMFPLTQVPRELDETSRVAGVVPNEDAPLVHIFEEVPFSESPESIQAGDGDAEAAAAHLDDDDDARSYVSLSSSVQVQAPDSQPADPLSLPTGGWNEMSETCPAAPVIKDLDVFSQSQTQSSQALTQPLTVSTAVLPSTPAQTPPPAQAEGSSPPTGPQALPPGSARMAFATERAVPNTTRNAAYGAIAFTELPEIPAFDAAP